MAKRHEMNRRCGQVRNLLEENKYTAALELIDTMSIRDVGSVEDLYLFADLYEKAERMEQKKEIFYHIYERTHSRHVLNRLLRLVLRMGDMEEARELFLAYEFAGDVTLETFELRYLLAKAEGEPRSVLIRILEELKKEEYTEEWGYQLARLYEQEGMRDECIRECKDLKLWFGEGRIVEKALELQKKCEAPDWEPPKDEEIPEPEEPEQEEMIAFASSPVRVTELGGEEETDEPTTDVETATDSVADDEMVTDSPADEKNDEIVADSPEDDEITDVAATPEPEVRIPKIKMPALKPKKKKPVESLDDMLKKDVLKDEPEDISERGIRYFTLKSTINQVRRNRQNAHFVFAGGEERITLAVAKRLTKELNNVGYFSAKSIVKITADKLNELELSKQIEKVAGGCMLVVGAPALNADTVADLVGLMKENGDQIVVMLTGSFDAMDSFLASYPELSEILCYKVRM
jgi:hypothetical protein